MMTLPERSFPEKLSLKFFITGMFLGILTLLVTPKSVLAADFSFPDFPFFNRFFYHDFAFRLFPIPTLAPVPTLPPFNDINRIGFLPTDTPTPTMTPAPTETPVPTETLAPTATPEPTVTVTPSPTDTPVPTDTPEPTATLTPSPTETPVPTDTPEPTATITPSPTETPVPTDTPEPTATLTPAPSDTPVPTPSDTPTPSVTVTPVPTDTSEPTMTETPTPTETVTPSPTDTPFPTVTDTPIPSETPTPSLTPTPTGAQTLRAGDLVINEIMWGGSSVSSADEWIELKNNTGKSVDLSGLTVKNLGGTAVPDITIPSGNIGPDGFFLVSNRSRTDSVLDVDPDYITTGISLSNAGEQLSLVKNGTVIDTANIAGPWYAGTSVNPKKSMARNNPSGDGTLAENWHTSASSLGLDAGSAELATPGNIND